MDIIKIIFTSIGSLAAMFCITRLTGNRQMSQMSMFDYVNGITVGSIAAEFATSLEQDFWLPLTAMAVYGLAAVAIAWGTCKSMALRRFFNGRPTVLFEHGKLYEQNLAAARMDINEFLTQCRAAGYFDLTQLESAVLETNGQVSFLPLSERRPVTPQDLGLAVQPEKPCVCVVMDGRVLAGNLRATGNDEVWLRRALAAQNAGRLEDVFLATVNAQNQLAVFARTGRQVKRELFE